MKLFKHQRDNKIKCRYRSGIVLMLTIVLLVILSILGYTIVTRLAAQRHRDQYIIDYQTARYACDSAVKYALAGLTVNADQLISRPNEPDFSDLFALDEEQYKQLLEDWARQNASNEFAATDDSNVAAAPQIEDLTDLNDFNATSDLNSLFAGIDMNETGPVTIRGPYGPAWPYVTEPLEFQIGAASVKIEIEDENAKYPLTWSMLGEKDGQREAEAGLETFCEWMKMDRTEIDDLQSQLKEAASIKTFKFDFQTGQSSTPAAAGQPARRGRGRRARRQQSQQLISAITHTADFAQLFHSSLVDLDTLARPIVVSTERQESALKYLGVWASKTVNVNSAPRQVLEAAFAFGGDGEKIADEIIKRRRKQPFKNIEDLKRALFRYSDSIKKTEKYITTVSDFFTIRVTATSGVARASAVIAVTMTEKKMQKIAVISE